MKNLLFAIVLLTYGNANAQISIEKIHIIATGRSIVECTDNGTYTLPETGNSKTWDYSQLQESSTDSTRFGMPFWYSGHVLFPEANRAYIPFNDTSIIHYELLTDNFLYDLGIYSKTDTSFLLRQLKIASLNLPATFMSTFTDMNQTAGLSIELGIDIDSTGPRPFLDSMRFMMVTDASSIMDGHGLLSTPLGSFQALHQTKLMRNYQKMQVFYDNDWHEADDSTRIHLGVFFPQPDSVYHCKFYTNSANIGVPLLSYTYRPRQTQMSNIRWLKTGPHLNSISSTFASSIQVYPNPTSNELNIELDGLFNWSIQNHLGQNILSGDAINSRKIDIKDLASGTYILTLSNESGERVSRLIRKN